MLPIIVTNKVTSQPPEVICDVVNKKGRHKDCFQFGISGWRFFTGLFHNKNQTARGNVMHRRKPIFQMIVVRNFNPCVVLVPIASLVVGFNFHNSFRIYLALKHFSECTFPNLVAAKQPQKILHHYCVIGNSFHYHTYEFRRPLSHLFIWALCISFSKRTILCKCSLYASRICCSFVSASHFTDTAP